MIFYNIKMYKRKLMVKFRIKVSSTNDTGLTNTLNGIKEKINLMYAISQGNYSGLKIIDKFQITSFFRKNLQTTLKIYIKKNLIFIFFNELTFMVELDYALKRLSHLSKPQQRTGIFLRTFFCSLYIQQNSQSILKFFESSFIFSKVFDINMQHFPNTTVFLPNKFTKKQTKNKKKSSQKLLQTPSFVNLLHKILPKPKRVAIHLQTFTQKIIKQKIHQKAGKKHHQSHKKPLENLENKRALNEEKHQLSTKNNLLFVPFQKQNLEIQTPVRMVTSPKQNRLQTPIFTKKRLYLNKKIQRQKENSFMIKKSSSFVRRELNRTFKYFTGEQEQILIERRNSKKEELYYVDELKKELKKMQDLIEELNEQIPDLVGHFFQTVKTFFKYKDIRLPEESKVSVFLGKSKKKNTLIFDMDQTLIHAEPYKKEIHDNSWGQNIQIMIDDGTKIMINLKIRPFVMEVLNRLKQKYQIGVFTAANETYAKQILRKIDPYEEIFGFQLYRQHCDVIEGKLAIKDLRILCNRSIKNVMLVDNSPHTYLYQKENAVPIVSFYDNLADNEMLKLQEFLEKNVLHKRQDVRDTLQKTFKFRKYTDFDSLEELLKDLY